MANLRPLLMAEASNSEFYEFCYPGVSRGTPKDHQHVFAEYGCLEAVNVEYNEPLKIFDCSAKKHKPLLRQGSMMLVEKQPALLLGKPSLINKLLYQPTYRDFFQIRNTHYKRKMRKVHLAKIDEQIHNLTLDHPDVAQGTFLELLSEYFPFQTYKKHIVPGAEAEINCEIFPSKFFPRSRICQDVRFPKSVDPYMFDVPHSLLNDLLREEIEFQTKNITHNTSYTGGSLSYKHIGQCHNFHYGVIASAQGQAMSELSLQLMSINANTDDFDGRKGIVSSPQLSLGSDYRLMLKNRALQTSITSSLHDGGRYFIGARSQNHVLLGMMNSADVEYKVEEKKLSNLSYASSDCLNVLGVVHSPSNIASMSLSPYIDGECTFTVDSRKLCLWKAGASSSVNLSQQKEINGVESFDIVGLDQSSDNWSQVEFASHPRQVLIANRKSVSVFDMRGKFSKSRILYLPDDEMVMTILSGVNFSQSNEFQHLASTSTNLLLMDQRFSKTPLLKWGTNMKFPCQQLTSIGFPLENETSANHTMVVAANQTGQEVHAYQYMTKYHRANPVFSSAGGMKLGPPESVCRHMAIGSFRDVRRALSGHPFRNRGHVIRRLSYPVTGIAGVSYKTPYNDPEILAMQMSECGDLLYQTFHLKSCSDVYSVKNVVSNEEFEGRNATKCSNSKAKAAEESCVEWAETVASDYQKAVDEEDPMNLRCTRTFLPTFKFSATRLATDLTLQCKTIKAAKDCPVCENQTSCDGNTEDLLNPEKSFTSSDDEADFLTTNDLMNIHSEDGGGNRKCMRCGNDVAMTNAFFQNQNSSVPRPFTAAVCDDYMEEFGDGEGQFPAYGRPSFDQLELINPTPTKTGLGRVLVSTWERPYEELWETFKQEFLEVLQKDKEASEKAVFDLCRDRPAAGEVGDDTSSILSDICENVKQNTEITTEVPESFAVDYNSNVVHINTPSFLQQRGTSGQLVANQNTFETTAPDCQQVAICDSSEQHNVQLSPAKLSLPKQENLRYESDTYSMSSYTTMDSIIEPFPQSIKPSKKRKKHKKMHKRKISRMEDQRDIKTIVERLPEEDSAAKNSFREERIPMIRELSSQNNNNGTSRGNHIFTKVEPQVKLNLNANSLSYSPYSVLGGLNTTFTSPFSSPLRSQTLSQGSAKKKRSGKSIGFL
ncbi:uncharacterized protein LOC143450105 isoform X2 [Clavelina lepadiformis]|uniref:uncharacterized protein LOC143450105 isoform X2 n=1 Tax=Clavelina lepadiformis TaxID=159417 RepID=UPI00404315F7